MSGLSDFEFECCLITYGNTRPSLLYRIRRALRTLRMPVPPGAAIVMPYPESDGPVSLAVGYGGRLDVGGRLTLGPGCFIHGRAAGGFVIQIPRALETELGAWDDHHDR